MIYCRILLILSLLFLSSIGCSNELEKNKILIIDENKILIQIDKIKNKELEKGGYSLLYGSAEISKHDSKIKTINLDCLFLSVGKVDSQKVYVDSVASVITDAYPLPQSSTEISLYWKMTGIVNENNLKNLSVSLMDDCKLFSNLDFRQIYKKIQ